MDLAITLERTRRLREQARIARAEAEQTAAVAQAMWARAQRVLEANRHTLRSIQRPRRAAQSEAAGTTFDESTTTR